MLTLAPQCANNETCNEQFPDESENEECCNRATNVQHRIGDVNIHVVVFSVMVIVTPLKT